MHSTNFSNVPNSKLPLQTFFIFTIILMLAISATWWFTRNYCNKAKITDGAFLRLDSSLHNCIRFLINDNVRIATEMENRLKDPTTVNKALIWKSKLDSVLTLSNSMQKYIQLIKEQLSGPIENRGLNSKNSFSYASDISHSLFDSLNRFSANLRNLVHKEQQSSPGLLPVHRLLSVSPNQWQETFKSDYFSQMSQQAAITMLSQIESDVLQSSNIVLDYIINQTGSVYCPVQYYSPMATQNTTCLFPGQTLEITAGIGSYASEIYPSITIDNKKIILTSEGNGVYKKIITGGKGGSIPIVISYKSPNTGQLLTVSKNISYKVFHPPK